MNKRRLITEVENSLLTLGTATRLEERRPGEFIDVHYRNIREDIEKARLPLIELGMYESVKTVIDVAESLLKSRQYDEAGAVLHKTYQELTKKSGTDERNERRYGKNGPAAQGAAMVATADGVEEWGVLGPDAYAGAFLQSVSTAERDLVFAVDRRFFGLRSDVLAEQVDAVLGSKDAGDKLATAYQGVREAMAKAQPLLEKLGVYAMLQGALSHAQSLSDDGEFAEAEQLLEVAAQALGDRCGTAALRARHFPRSGREGEAL